MRLASHILAVFLAVSTVVSPCLASIKASKDAADHRKQAALAILQDNNRAISATVRDEITDVCNGPCARLVTFRNIQPLRYDIVGQLDAVEPVYQQFQHNTGEISTTIQRLVSLTNWNSVDIYQLCRQLN